jgi:hypothetical protein
MDYFHRNENTFLEESYTDGQLDPECPIIKQCY